MREPGSGGNLNVMFFKNLQIICLMTLLTKGEEGQTLIRLGRSIVHHFRWNLLENMTNRFLHIPDFAWISHALPLKAPMVQKQIFLVEISPLNGWEAYDILIWLDTQGPRY